MIHQTIDNIIITLLIISVGMFVMMVRDHWIEIEDDLEIFNNEFNNKTNY